MDLQLSVTIDAKDHGLKFRSVKLRQALYMPCTLEVELIIDNRDYVRKTRKKIPQWIGKLLVVRIADKLNPAVAREYRGLILRCSLSSDTVQIFAASEDHVLTVACKNRSFVEMDVTGIIKEIVKGLSAQTKIVESTASTMFKFFQQYNETDYECLLRLAHYDGYVIYHDGDSFVISNGLDGGADLTLSAEEVFDLKLTCALGPTQWTAAPYDYAKHSEPAANRLQSVPLALAGPELAQQIYDVSKSIYNSQVQELYNQTIVNKDKFETFLGHQQNFAAGDHLLLTGSTYNPRLAVGCTIRSAEVDLLDEPYVVSSMSAEFGSDNVYVAHFEALALSAKVAPPLPPSRDTDFLQPAEVIDNEDKEQMGRVQIRYLWDEAGRACCWARLAQAGAGKKDGVAYGTHFTPRIGDHVLVAFEHGDPSLPIILGALYHSEKKPDVLTSNGAQEVLLARTPQESTIRVLDTQGEEEIVIAMRDNKNLIRLELKQPRITVESQGGLIVAHAKNIQVLADETMELKARDIEISAEKNITVKAGENRSVEVQKEYTMKVGGNAEESVSGNKEVKVGGNLSEQASGEIALGATAAVKVESTQIESSAGATNTIKGAIVQIN